MNNFEGLHISQNRLTDPKSDRDVLMDLYNAINGHNWKRKTNWGSDAPISKWEGVNTDSSGRVMELNLQENQLTGMIPAALGSLKKLKGTSKNCSMETLPKIIYANHAKI
ncbi:MAG: hypothetical protein ERJ67_08270 [Aphanocapsa feldmannii 277cV]|uniref:Leucine-rich repeat domain-containing protein n=1 Tax=Aphanocapsa feldmannii 277cV TaxID=2507553 RepID=A0A524RN32_9CHRO|nr:MAG: hypothetical protein ERJ67_08270 [Aphanocapsa feldmannii 277cV]